MALVCIAIRAAFRQRFVNQRMALVCSAIRAAFQQRFCQPTNGISL